MWSVENLPNLLFLEDLDKHMLPLTLCFFSLPFSAVSTQVYFLLSIIVILYIKMSEVWSKGIRTIEMVTELKYAEWSHFAQTDFELWQACTIIYKILAHILLFIAVFENVYNMSHHTTQVPSVTMTCTAVFDQVWQPPYFQNSPLATFFSSKIKSYLKVKRFQEFEKIQENIMTQLLTIREKFQEWCLIKFVSSGDWLIQLFPIAYQTFAVFFKPETRANAKIRRKLLQRKLNAKQICVVVFFLNHQSQHFLIRPCIYKIPQHVVSYSF